MGDAAMVHWACGEGGQIQSFEVATGDYVTSEMEGAGAYRKEKLAELVAKFAAGLELTVKVRRTAHLPCVSKSRCKSQRCCAYVSCMRFIACRAAQLVLQGQVCPAGAIVAHVLARIYPADDAGARISASLVDRSFACRVAATPQAQRHHKQPVNILRKSSHHGASQSQPHFVTQCKAWLSR